MYTPREAQYRAKLYCTRRIGVLEQCILGKATVRQDLLDGPLELGTIKPTLKLALNVDTMVLLLEDLVGRCILITQANAKRGI